MTMPKHLIDDHDEIENISLSSEGSIQDRNGDFMDQSKRRASGKNRKVVSEGKQHLGSIIDRFN